MKRIMFFVVWGISSCTTDSSTQEEKNIAHVQRMFDAFNRHDWKSMSEHYADSALFLDPAFGTDYVYQLRTETASKYAKMEKMFPTIRDEVVSIFAHDDKVAVEFVSTGTSSDSVSFVLPIICILTLQNNLIVKDATYYNNCQ